MRRGACHRRCSTTLAVEGGPASQVLLLEGWIRGQPFFAVLVDPGRRLSLPPLYKEKP